MDFTGIPGQAAWKTVTIVDKGWSKDLKYYVMTQDGGQLLVRLSDVTLKEKKKLEFEFMKRCSNLGFPMSKPLAFGNVGAHCYILLTWLEGKDMEEALPGLSPEKQYALGLEAGKILRQIHSLPVTSLPGKNRTIHKMEQLEWYERGSLRRGDDKTVIAFVRTHMDVLGKMGTVCLHGDFHVGNLILTPDNGLGVIDFNRWKYGDPCEEFYKVQSFDVDVSIPFAVGQIRGYFDGEPPEIFWEALAVYVAHSTLISLNWASQFGEKDIENMRRIGDRAMRDYDGFRSMIPAWYREYI